MKGTNLTIFLAVLTLLNLVTVNGVSIGTSYPPHESNVSLSPPVTPQQSLPIIESKETTARAVAVSIQDSQSVEFERLLRTERFKSRLLQKLQLTTPPNISSPVTLPEVLFQTERLSHNHRQHVNKVENLESTSKLFLFADKDRQECDLPDTSVCFRFPVPSRKEERLAAAQLWVYLKPDFSSNSTKRTIIASFPAMHYDGSHTLAKQDVYIREGWVEFPLRNTIKHFNTSQHYIKITCKPNPPSGSIVATRGSLRPILSMTYIRKNRERRGSNRGGSTTTCDPLNDCCMGSLDVSFSEIGWSSWIHFPLSYTANYCTGVCTSVIPAGEYHNIHSQVLTTWLLRQAQGSPVSMTPCCVPSSLGTLDILFLNEDNVVNQTTLLGMTANGCHCVID